MIPTVMVPMTTTTITIMTEPTGTLDLLRLQGWLSPVFPVGAFSYSHGLERAAHDGLPREAGALEQWLQALLAHGSAWNDAVLLAAAWRAARSSGELSEIAELAEALAGSAERHRETMLQGNAFLKAAAAWPCAALDALDGTAAYCVAVGAVAGAHGVPLGATLAAFLQGFAVNQLQAAIRLGLTGQNGAVGVLARLEPLLIELAAAAEGSTLDDLGSSTFLAEIAAMNHEIQHSRLFRS